jgi:hypothetical protein
MAKFSLVLLRFARMLASAQIFRLWQKERKRHRPAKFWGATI